MNPEQPKEYTPEEIAKFEKSRTISDADLLRRGAEYKIDDSGEKRLDTTNAWGADYAIRMSKKLDEIKDLSPQEHVERVKSLFDKIDRKNTLVTYYDTEGSLCFYSIPYEARRSVKINGEKMVIDMDPIYEFIPLKNIVNISIALM